MVISLKCYLPAFAVGSAEKNTIISGNPADTGYLSVRIIGKQLFYLGLIRCTGGEKKLVILAAFKDPIVNIGVKFADRFPEKIIDRQLPVVYFRSDAAFPAQVRQIGCQPVRDIHHGVDKSTGGKGPAKIDLRCRVQMGCSERMPPPLLIPGLHHSPIRSRIVGAVSFISVI